MPTLKFKNFPNIFKTIAPVKIARPKVTKAYFAEATIEEVEMESDSGAQENEIYTVVSGDTLGKIANKKGTTVAAIIESDATITTANQNGISIGQQITLPSTVAAKEKKEKITFKKLTTGNLGEDIYVIVETELLQGRTMAINIRQGKEKGIEEQDKNITLKDDQDKYHETIKTTIGGMKDTDYLNKDDFPDQAIFKIAVDHSDEEKKKAWTKAIEDATDKKTLLYILTDAHSLDGQEELNITYLGDTEEGEVRGEKITNRWLDLDGEWFELKKGCDCGKSLNLKFKCEDYSSFFGPYYGGKDEIKNYSKWDDLITNGELTQSKKDILIAVMNNEGKLDSVQSYDSEVVSVGAMQKTINTKGEGEFPIQVKEFKVDFPDKYKELFEDCGWTVEGKKMYYKNPSDSSSLKVTGKELRTKIREGFDASTLNTKIECHPLEPLVKAAKDIDFHTKQIKDAKNRMENSLNVKPVKIYSGSKKNKNITERYPYKIKKYLKSDLGKALIFDHSINRPAYPIFDFGTALNDFFTEKDQEVEEYNEGKDKKDHKSNISRNPNEWGDNHKSYEDRIIELYGPNRDMTHASVRYNKLKNKL